MPTSDLFKEKKDGKLSILRIFLVFIMILLVHLVILWTYAFITEVKMISNEFRVDYTSLFTGLGVLLGAGLLGLAWKVIQKKFE